MTLNSKYFDQYYGTNGTDLEQRINIRRGHLGDATMEIMKNYGSETGAWNTDYSRFGSLEVPWATRGGFAGDNKYAGIFAFDRLKGQEYPIVSFRIVISKE